MKDLPSQRRVRAYDRTIREGTQALLINLLAWLIVGGIACWLASLIVWGSGIGILSDVTVTHLVDVIVGIVGALIGGFVLSLLLLGAFGLDGFTVGNLVVALMGTVSLQLIVRHLTGWPSVAP
jgi:uncharacterized membrane protein YeaQ/YmgE (transglycosylase-associated protein family)